MAKNPLIPLELTAATSAINAAIPKELVVSGITKLIISNGETDESMKIIKSLEESGLLIKIVNETIKYKKFLL